jgi:DNA-binding helix-hairpin-helix protein with protein kinase domain
MLVKTPLGVNLVKDNVDFIKNRLMVCSNIAKAFHFLHITNKYVVVDLKPENILVSEKGKIAVCDLDSIQISNNNKVLYHAGCCYTKLLHHLRSKYLTACK